MLYLIKCHLMWLVFYEKFMNFVLNWIELLKLKGLAIKSDKIHTNIQISRMDQHWCKCGNVWAITKYIFSYTGSPQVKILQKVGGYFFDCRTTILSILSSADCGWYAGEGEKHSTEGERETTKRWESSNWVAALSDDT